jgi:hypothetical protein
MRKSTEEEKSESEQDNPSLLSGSGSGTSEKLGVLVKLLVPLLQDRLDEIALISPAPTAIISSPEKPVSITEKEVVAVPEKKTFVFRPEGVRKRYRKKAIELVNKLEQYPSKVKFFLFLTLYSIYTNDNFRLHGIITV